MQVLTPSMRIYEALVIDSNGKSLGKMKIAAAEQLADQQGLDLVLITPGANPVCKIMDYGKHKFQQQKNAKKQKSAAPELKELNFSYAIAEHDYQVRRRSVEKFMASGSKAKITIKLRGREADHAQLAVNLLNRLYKDTETVAVQERAPTFEGRNVVMVLAPRSYSSS